jgi:hypothetical protein
MKRRTFFAVAAAAPALPCTRVVDSTKIPTRNVGDVETVFKSPGPKPNGLQATAGGLWIIDQGDNRAYLVDYRNGSVLRSLDTEADRASGITFDGEAIWLASTYSRELIRADAKTGKTIRKYFTPGAGIIYRMVGDPAGRSSPLVKHEHGSSPPERRGRDSQAGSLPQPEAAGGPAPGTGAHGLEWRDGRLWVAVPPSRMIYRIDPQQWIVEHQFPTAGNRPHGIGWEGKWLWCTDSNLNAFFKHDAATGEIVEKIQLADAAPLPHGMSIWEDHLWYCDDVGVVCRLKMRA